MREEILNAIKDALKKMNVKEKIELTPSKNHGDFSTNIAMKIAGSLKKNPRAIAEEIVSNLKSDSIRNVTIDGPGFINIFLNTNSLTNIIQNIIDKKDKFGSSNQNKYINVEYPSANPTGYLHLGHARISAIGSSLVNILKFAGNKVDSECYVNDAGNQINTLGNSTYLRYQELFNKKIEFPEDSYKGSDIIDAAKYIKNKIKDKYVNSSYEEKKEYFKQEAKDFFLDKMKEQLGLYDVKIDIYFSETSLYKAGVIEKAIAKLGNNVYENENATWLKTIQNGDDKDRVLIKSDGAYTYLMPDIAYHKIKLDRGYDELINIWGSDHIGYIKRMEIALGYLGLPKEKLDILIVQIVKLFKDGKEVKMSKRKGKTFLLTELIEEVGIDAARWFMIDRAINSEFVFDLDKATDKSNDNPVFSVQYSHARANQLIDKLGTINNIEEYNQKEIDLIQELNKFPEIVLAAANTHKINVVTQYLLSISRMFNSWYANNKAIGSDKEVILKNLAKATKIVISNGLNLLEISSPSKM